MGIITKSFSLLSGVVFGIYIAQNYNVPNVKKLVYENAKQFEQKYRKPKKPGED